jgi:hypothetical protein
MPAYPEASILLLNYYITKINKPVNSADENFIGQYQFDETNTNVITFKNVDNDSIFLNINFNYSNRLW